LPLALSETTGNLILLSYLDYEKSMLTDSISTAAYADIPAEYCVWLDEATIDDLTNQRTTGWAAMG
jgi:hypothetical protein